MDIEQWRTVPGYPRYEASNLGRIKGPRSLTFGSITKYGYMRTTLRKGGVVGKGRDVGNVEKGDEVFVHRLVASAFHANPDSRPHVNHKDGNRSNNRADNLEWCTRLENLQHAWNVLETPMGHSGSDAIMKPEDVQAIRRMHLNGQSATQIAEETGRKYRTILAIVRRRNWRHLDWPS